MPNELSPAELAQTFEVQGSWGLLLKDPFGIGPGAIATLPTAGAEYRGLMLRTEGGTGVADEVAVCRKNSDDVYEWVQLNDTMQFVVGGIASQTYSNQGAGPTQKFTDSAIDLSVWKEVKMVTKVTTAGVTAVVKAVYTLNLSDYVALTPTVSMAATGRMETAWVPIPEAARTVCWVAEHVTDGDGAEDPILLAIILYLRR